MKIGIVTLPLHTNYGGILQAYALQTILKEMGHEVFLINNGWKKQTASIRILSKMKWILKSIASRKRLYSPYQIQEISGSKIKPFVLKQFPKKISFTHPSEIMSLQLDAIIVGSDQVWRRIYSSNIAFYYLDFAEYYNIKRIAYGASFGIDEWDYTTEETEKCKRLLGLFSEVSVRELAGKELCAHYFNINAELVLDPTLLLPVKDYSSIYSECTDEINGELLCYILDDNSCLQNIIEQVSSSTNYRSYYTNINEKEMRKHPHSHIKPSIAYWLKGFSQAKFVITDSFHGCVFSILFNKPFIAYGNSQRGITRFQSLLTLFNLQDRLVSNETDAITKINELIDWGYINVRLNELRGKSINFLKKSLS